jgi:hypothetical protein
MDEDRERRIRERAHDIWEREGRPHGRHEEHWRQASQEIGDELFSDDGATDAQERRGGLDGGLLPAGGLVAAGGPGGAGIGGLGMAGEPTEDDEDGSR